MDDFEMDNFEMPEASAPQDAAFYEAPPEADPTQQPTAAEPGSYQPAVDNQPALYGPQLIYNAPLGANPAQQPTAGAPPPGPRPQAPQTPPMHYAPGPAYIAPPGAYSPQPGVYYAPGAQPAMAAPTGAPLVMMVPQPLYVQQPQATPSGYHEGQCSCGGTLGSSRWTIVAWLLCFFFCPFNFCIPQCMPESRSCQRCGKEYYKP